MYRLIHTVRDARVSYAEAWRVIAAARTMPAMRKALAVQCTVQVRRRACGNARDMLSARAHELERFSLLHFLKNG